MDTVKLPCLENMIKSEYWRAVVKCDSAVDSALLQGVELCIVGSGEFVSLFSNCGKTFNYLKNKAMISNIVTMYNNVL